MGRAFSLTGVRAITPSRQRGCRAIASGQQPLSAHLSVARRFANSTSMKPRHAAALTLLCAVGTAAPAHANPSSLVIQPALLPVPYSVNEREDPTTFKPAPPNAALHEYVSFPGWVTAADFDALHQWLLTQGFVIVTAVAPEQGITYASLRFHGNAAKFNRAFHVTVMEKFLGGHYCYAVFTPLMMPARFAPKGADKIEGYGIGHDTSASRFGLGPTCP